jgi:hypothetical protein
MNIKTLAVAGLLAVGGLMAVAPASHAATLTPTSQGSGNEFSYFNEYINAWSGGPNIDGFNGRAENDDFTIDQAGDGGEPVNLVATGGETTYKNYCIADSGNSQTDARAALVNCSSSTPWGANMTATSCSGGGTAFQVSHWPNGWLSFSGSANGSAMYLNGPKTCFAVSGAY